MQPLLVRWLGQVGYAAGVVLQDRLVARRRHDEVPDTLLLLEHEPVITCGRGADMAHLLVDRETLARRGIEVHESGRGGDVTYHGPGQLVGYPVLALAPERRDAHRYLRELEQVLIDAVAELGVTGRRVEGLTGVWVGERKLAAIGVRLSTGWITSHGFALNVGTDLDGFRAIVPCGLHGRGVTSLAECCGVEPAMPEVAWRVVRSFCRVFGRRPVASPRPDERLGKPLDGEVCS
ncbi:MAG TPA: lipoyl(octanoyl) transferase LipB [Candidatus Polarisedimenticolaceae bacterium]|nr:lipoyl(octanoyl) transferase LipB [Candidatus Polarisedimenticolaceae bacterium]